MKRVLLLALGMGLSFSNILADEVEKSYKKLISYSMFTSNNQILKSGWYHLDDDIDLNNANFGGSYYFGEKGDRVRVFILGGIGLSKVEKDNINLHRSRSSIDNIELKSFYLKAGGGVTYNFNEELGLTTGLSAMKMKSYDDIYETKRALDLKDYKDRKIDTLFNEDRDNNLYDIFANILYHPEIAGYHTYFLASLHYLNFDYDEPISSVDGYSLDLISGIHTPTLAKIYNYPVWMEFYTGSNILEDKLSDVVGFKKAISVGSYVHWKVGPFFKDILNGALKDLDINFNLQGTVGDNGLNGWKVSGGVGIVKF